jgi:hypothetical protein
VHQIRQPSKFNRLGQLKRMPIRGIKMTKSNYTNVRGCNATTMVPLTTPSPFNFIHRPRRCSWPMPATRSMVLTFEADEVRFVSEDSPSWLGEAHDVRGKASFGVYISWRELTNPGAGMVPMSENDLSLESSFHNRMFPSQDPNWENSVHEHEKITT